MSILSAFVPSGWSQSRHGHELRYAGVRTCPRRAPTFVVRVAAPVGPSPPPVLEQEMAIEQWKEKMVHPLVDEEAFDALLDAAGDRVVVVMFHATCTLALRVFRVRDQGLC